MFNLGGSWVRNLQDWGSAFAFGQIFNKIVKKVYLPRLFTEEKIGVEVLP